MADYYRLMHRLFPGKYICIMQSEHILDCYEHRNTLPMYHRELEIWSSAEYTKYDRTGIIIYTDIEEFGEGTYG